MLIDFQTLLAASAPLALMVANSPPVEKETDIFSCASYLFSDLPNFISSLSFFPTPSYFYYRNLTFHDFHNLSTPQTLIISNMIFPSFIVIYFLIIKDQLSSLLIISLPLLILLIMNTVTQNLRESNQNYYLILWKQSTFFDFMIS